MGSRGLWRTNFGLGAQIYIQDCFGGHFFHRLLLLLNIQIEKSLIRVLFEYSNTIEWQYKKQVTYTKEWQFWPPIFKASATPDCSVLFMHSLFFPFCGKLGLESCINPRDYSDVTYMAVYMYRPCSTFFLETWRFRVIMIAHSLIAHSPIRSVLCVQTPLRFF